jgi:hypothetical protein
MTDVAVILHKDALRAYFDGNVYEFFREEDLTSFLQEVEGSFQLTQGHYIIKGAAVFVTQTEANALAFRDKLCDPTFCSIILQFVSLVSNYTLFNNDKLLHTTNSEELRNILREMPLSTM